MTFVPSKHLVSYMENGIHEAFRLAEESKEFDKKLLKQMRKRKIKPLEELIPVLSDVIGGCLCETSSTAICHDLKEFKLTQNKEFVQEFKATLEKRIAVIPEEFERFHEQLAYELFKHLETHEIKEADGFFKVANHIMHIKDGELVLECTYDPTPNFAPTARAVRIKMDDLNGS